MPVLGSSSDSLVMGEVPTHDSYQSGGLSRGASRGGLHHSLSRTLHFLFTERSLLFPGASSVGPPEFRRYVLPNHQHAVGVGPCLQFGANIMGHTDRDLWRQLLVH